MLPYLVLVGDDGECWGSEQVLDEGVEKCGAACLVRNVLGCQVCKKQKQGIQRGRGRKIRCEFFKRFLFLVRSQPLRDSPFFSYSKISVMMGLSLDSGDTRYTPRYEYRCSTLPGTLKVGSSMSSTTIDGTDEEDGDDEDEDDDGDDDEDEDEDEEVEGLDDDGEEGFDDKGRVCFRQA